MAKPGLTDHPKFRRLVYLLREPPPHVRGYLEFMWEVGYREGNPLLGDSIDVELAAGYPHDPGKLCDALLKARFIDEVEPGKYAIHDLMEHAPRFVQVRSKRRTVAHSGAQCAHSVRENGPESVSAPPFSSPPIPPSSFPHSTDSAAAAAQREEAAAAANSPLPQNPAAVTTPQRPGQVNPTAEASAAGDAREPLLYELERRGLPAVVVERYAASTDPALLREILDFHARKQRLGELKDPVAALRGMIRDPQGWGFVATETGWKPPPDGQARPKPKVRALSPEQAEFRRQKGLSLGLAGEDLEHYVRTGKEPEKGG
jgi:hypothetical protein